MMGMKPSDKYELHIEDAEMGELRDEIGVTPLLDPGDTENTKPLEKLTPISTYPNHLDCHVMIGN